VNDRQSIEGILGVELRYECELGQVPAQLAKSFVPLDFDAEAAAYLRRATAARPGRFSSFAQSVLRSYIGDFEANALLAMYPMHLLGTAQWRRLLGPNARGRLLDVGAGCGDVTATLAPCFSEVVATELARAAARRTRGRGIRCLSHDVAERGAPDPPYDVVACLNVLDRTNHPRSMLARARDALAADGRLVVALALPYDPFVYDGGTTLPPAQPFGVRSPTFEAAVVELVQNELEPLELDVQSWTRAPYLSGGDARAPLYVLDDALLVCRLRA
jgi:SAM-dependent methyltransferase